jgi:branched-chain amino acid transport system substrate-binding protein
MEEEIKMKKVVALLLCVLFCLALFAGCAGKSNDTIKVGILGCHTGEYAIYGLAVRNGAELYINKLNGRAALTARRSSLLSMTIRLTMPKQSLLSPAWLMPE